MLTQPNWVLLAQGLSQAGSQVDVQGYSHLDLDRAW